MNEQTTNRRAVEHLAAGDHVSDANGVHRLVHHFGFRDGDGRRMRALTFEPLCKGQPWMAKVQEGHLFHLATDDEIAEVGDTRRRAALHDDLVALHGLLGALGVRVAAHLGDGLRLPVVDGEVSRLAEKLGLPLEPFGYAESPNQAVEWTAPGDEDRGERLTVRFWGKPAPELPELDELAAAVDKAFLPTRDEQSGR